MAKKLTVLAMVLAVVALIVPATAAAEDFELLPVGTTMRLTSTNMRVETEVGELACTEMRFEGELEKNGGTLFIEELEGTAKGCTIGADAITIEPIALTNTFSNEGGKGTVDIAFVASIPGGIQCHFEGEDFFTYALHTDTTTFMGELESAVCGEAFVEGNTTDQYKNEEGKWEPAIWI